MLKIINRIVAFAVMFCLVFEQSGFAQVAPDMNIPAYLSGLTAADKFRPMHMRWLSYDPLNNAFDLAVEPGDDAKIKEQDIKKSTSRIMEYFQIGLRLPDSMFWVNLRPDAPDQIIDPYLGRTDIGKIMLEADLQLKKDLARFTSPDTKAGREYWNKLYARAEQVFGPSDITIPTVTRPWIVPNEIIIKEYKDGAYVFKATMKVMLEQDHLKDAPGYSFDDPRVKEINEYSSELVRQLIIPQLTREVNSSKRYAGLRQVFYSLILSQWFKQRYAVKAGVEAGSEAGTGRAAAALLQSIDSRDLSGLTSTTAWSKESYFNQYVQSFQKGEYNKQETVNGPSGMTVRQYFSGGILFKLQQGVDVIDRNAPLMTILPAVEASPSPVVLRATVIGDRATVLGDPQQYKLDFLGAKLNISVLPKQDLQQASVAFAQPEAQGVGRDGGITSFIEKHTAAISFAAAGGFLIFAFLNPIGGPVWLISLIAAGGLAFLGVRKTASRDEVIVMGKEEGFGQYDVEDRIINENVRKFIESGKLEGPDNWLDMYRSYKSIVSSRLASASKIEARFSGVVNPSGEIGSIGAIQPVRRSNLSDSKAQYFIPFVFENGHLVPESWWDDVSEVRLAHVLRSTFERLDDELADGGKISRDVKMFSGLAISSLAFLLGFVVLDNPWSAISFAGFAFTGLGAGVKLTDIVGLEDYFSGDGGSRVEAKPMSLAQIKFLLDLLINDPRLAYDVRMEYPRYDSSLNIFSSSKLGFWLPDVFKKLDSMMEEKGNVVVKFKDIQGIKGYGRDILQAVMILNGLMSARSAIKLIGQTNYNDFLRLRTATLESKDGGYGLSAPKLAAWSVGSAIAGFGFSYWLSHSIPNALVFAAFIGILQAALYSERMMKWFMTQEDNYLGPEELRPRMDGGSDAHVAEKLDALIRSIQRKNMWISQYYPKIARAKDHAYYYPGILNAFFEFNAIGIDLDPVLDSDIVNAIEKIYAKPYTRGQQIRNHFLVFMGLRLWELETKLLAATILKQHYEKHGQPDQAEEFVSRSFPKFVAMINEYSDISQWDAFWLGERRYGEHLRECAMKLVELYGAEYVERRLVMFNKKAQDILSDDLHSKDGGTNSFTKDIARLAGKMTVKSAIAAVLVAGITSLVIPYDVKLWAALAASTAGITFFGQAIYYSARIAAETYRLTTYVTALLKDIYQNFNIVSVGQRDEQADIEKLNKKDGGSEEIQLLSKEYFSAPEFLNRQLEHVERTRSLGTLLKVFAGLSVAVVGAVIASIIVIPLTHVLYVVPLGMGALLALVAGVMIYEGSKAVSEPDDLPPEVVRWIQEQVRDPFVPVNLSAASLSMYVSNHPKLRLVSRDMGFGNYDRVLYAYPGQGTERKISSEKQKAVMQSIENYFSSMQDVVKNNWYRQYGWKTGEMMKEYLKAQENAYFYRGAYAVRHAQHLLSRRDVYTLNSDEKAQFEFLQYQGRDTEPFVRNIFDRKVREIFYRYDQARQEADSGNRKDGGSADKRAAKERRHRLTYELLDLLMRYATPEDYVVRDPAAASKTKVVEEADRLFFKNDVTNEEMRDLHVSLDKTAKSSGTLYWVFMGAGVLAGAAALLFWGNPLLMLGGGCAALASIALALAQLFSSHTYEYLSMLVRRVEYARGSEAPTQEAQAMDGGTGDEKSFYERLKSAILPGKEAETVEPKWYAETAFPLTDEFIKKVVFAKQRIALVADDDFNMLRNNALKYLMQGYFVVRAKDGTEAWEIYQKVRSAGRLFDVVNTDRYMPQMRGDELSWLIDSQVPVIMVTGEPNINAAQYKLAAVLDKHGFFDSVLSQTLEPLGLSGKADKEIVLEALIGLAHNSEEPRERMFAIDMLAAFDEEAGNNALRELSGNDDVLVRRAVFSAIKNIWDDAMVELSISAARDPDLHVRYFALYHLLFSSRSATDAQKQEIVSLAEGLLSDPNKFISELAAQVLEKYGSDKTFDLRIRQLKHSDPNVRRKGAEALGDLKDARAVPALIEALKDEDDLVRGEAARALSYIGDRTALIPLAEALTREKSRQFSFADMDIKFALQILEREGNEAKDGGLAVQSEYAMTDAQYVAQILKGVSDIQNRRGTQNALTGDEWKRAIAAVLHGLSSIGLNRLLEVRNNIELAGLSDAQRSILDRAIADLIAAQALSVIDAGSADVASKDGGIVELSQNIRDNFTAMTIKEYDAAYAELKSYLRKLNAQLREHGIAMQDYMTIDSAMNALRDDRHVKLQNKKTFAFITRLAGPLMDIVDANGQTVAQTQEWVAHMFGLPHRAAYALVFGPHDEVVFQRLANDRVEAGSLAAFGSHVEPGADDRETVRRELMNDLRLHSLQGRLLPLGKAGQFTYDVAMTNVEDRLLNNNEYRALFAYFLTQEEFDQIRKDRNEMTRDRGLMTYPDFAQSGLWPVRNYAIVSFDALKRAAADGRHAFYMEEEYTDRVETGRVAFSSILDGIVIAQAQNDTGSVTLLDELQELKDFVKVGNEDLLDLMEGSDKEKAAGMSITERLKGKLSSMKDRIRPQKDDQPASDTTQRDGGVKDIGFDIDSRKLSDNVKYLRDEMVIFASRRDFPGRLERLTDEYIYYDYDSDNLKRHVAYIGSAISRLNNDEIVANAPYLVLLMDCLVRYIVEHHVDYALKHKVFMQAVRA
ncbi:MAG TPA: HEAT repeat domain-containing protein, partial [Candidatus Omnitrophota bacterium]|nr:HEAT repeat domain-containing protein [Candidatus Omnitrophota bacterium]